jgi:hypothetical protein
MAYLSMKYWQRRAPDGGADLQACGGRSALGASSIVIKPPPGFTERAAPRGVALVSPMTATRCEVVRVALARAPGARSVMRSTSV